MRLLLKIYIPNMQHIALDYDEQSLFVFQLISTDDSTSVINTHVNQMVWWGGEREEWDLSIVQ